MGGYVVNVEEDTWKMHNLHLEITVIVVTLRIILPNTVWQNYLTSYQPMKNLTNFWLEPYRLKQDIKKRITWLKFWHLMTTMQNSNWTQVPNLTFFDKLELNDQQLIKTKVKLITYRGTESYRKSSRLWSARRKVWLVIFIVDANTQAIPGKNACTETRSTMHVHSVQKDLSKKKPCKIVCRCFQRNRSTSWKAPHQSTLTKLLLRPYIHWGGSLSHSVI